MLWLHKKIKEQWGNINFKILGHNDSPRKIRSILSQSMMSYFTLYSGWILLEDYKWTQEIFGFWQNEKFSKFSFQIWKFSLNFVFFLFKTILLLIKILLYLYFVLFIYFVLSLTGALRLRRKKRGIMDQRPHMLGIQWNNGFRPFPLRK